MKICSIEGCEGEFVAKGFCEKHYRRYKSNGDPLVTQVEMDHTGCYIPGCLEEHSAKGLCKKHYDLSYNESHKEVRSKYRQTETYKKRKHEVSSKRKYGISLAEYTETLNIQQHKCAICMDDCMGNKNIARLCIDHEHIGGYKDMLSEEKMRYFRGLLCHYCNIMLKEGYDNIENLQGLVQYLKNPPAKVLGLKFNRKKRKAIRGILISKFGKYCNVNPNHIPGNRGIFSIDHHHKTKDVRGLLCHNCNTILGHAREDILILENAIRYLENYQNKKENICN